MTLRRQHALLLAAALCIPLAAMAAAPKAQAKAQAKAEAKEAKKAEHSFGVVGHSFGKGGGLPQLEQSLAKMRGADVDFVVVTGIKGKWESCSDTLYNQRRAALNKTRQAVVVIPAASDWADCRNSAGRPLGVERLNRLREILYPEAASLGQRPLELTRMSLNPTFRSYAENAYWVRDKVMYATVNIASNNNLYRPEAGRNNEFEDRAVANRHWLNRLFAQARRKRLDAIVLFMEGNAGVLLEQSGLLERFRPRSTAQDGYAGPRKQIGMLAEKFKGKVLLIDTAALANGTEPGIAWKDNLGHVSIGARAMQVLVTPGEDDVFTLDQP